MNRIIILGRVSKLGTLLWAGKKHRRKITLIEDVGKNTITYIVLAYEDLAESPLHVGDTILAEMHFDLAKNLVLDKVSIQEGLSL
jgi:hypothetical protein